MRRWEEGNSTSLSGCRASIQRQEGRARKGRAKREGAEREREREGEACLFWFQVPGPSGGRDEEEDELFASSADEMSEEEIIQEILNPADADGDKVDPSIIEDENEQVPRGEDATAQQGATQPAGSGRKRGRDRLRRRDEKSTA